MLKIVLIAIAPSLALLLYIYQKDRYDREPPQLLLKLFFLGVLSTVPVYFVERFLISYNSYSAAFQAFIVAGITEEFAKYIIIMSFAFRSRYYNEKLDGIVYAVFTSLGFATAENLLYILSRAEGILYTGITRAIFSVPAHMLFAITMGYYLSLAKFSKSSHNSAILLLEALLMPVLLHGIYDYILMSKVYGYFLILIIFVIFLWKFNLKRLNIYVKESKDDFGRNRL